MNICLKFTGVVLSLCLLGMESKAESSSFPCTKYKCAYNNGTYSVSYEFRGWQKDSSTDPRTGELTTVWYGSITSWSSKPATGSPSTQPREFSLELPYNPCSPVAQISCPFPRQ
jgi:hypothetical protein